MKEPFSARDQAPFAGQWFAPCTATLRRCSHHLFPLQVSASSGPRSAGEEELSPSGKARGLRRSGQAGLRRHRRRGAVQQPARSPVVPQPSGAGQDENLPFMLDLQSLPGLANVDLSAQNPNIQVGSRSAWAVRGCGPALPVLPSLVWFPKRRKHLLGGVRVATAICLLGVYQVQIAGTDRVLATEIWSWHLPCS